MAGQPPDVMAPGRVRGQPAISNRGALRPSVNLTKSSNGTLNHAAGGVGALNGKSMLLSFVREIS